MSEVNMATISDYAVLSDGTVTLKIGGDIDHTFAFSLPANLSVASSSVLAWRFEAESNPNNLKWKFDINGTDVISFTHNSDRFCSLHEVVAGNILKVGSNTATVRVLSGSGQIRVSDAVLHFQATV
jgi:hypothetical protein